MPRSSNLPVAFVGDVLAEATGFLVQAAIDEALPIVVEFEFNSLRESRHLHFPVDGEVAVAGVEALGLEAAELDGVSAETCSRSARFCPICSALAAFSGLIAGWLTGFEAKDAIQGAGLIHIDHSDGAAQLHPTGATAAVEMFVQRFHAALGFGGELEVVHTRFGEFGGHHPSVGAAGFHRAARRVTLEADGLAIVLGYQQACGGVSVTVPPLSDFTTVSISSA